MSTRTTLICFAALLLLIGVMAYGWGRDSVKGAAYKAQAKAAQEALDVLRAQYDSAGMRIEGLTKAMELRTPETDKLIAREKNESQRLKDEHATLDTAGAGTIRRIITWSTPH